MKRFLNTGSVLVAAVILAATAASAAAAPSAHIKAKAASSAVVKVDHEGKAHRHRRHHRRHYEPDVVEAPYTYVESGERVIVDAPYAHVHVDRDGHHIVAPFVDLWIPR